MSDLPLTAVVPVYHEQATITATLEGLFATVPDTELEVLVVYDTDDDPTLPVVQGLTERWPGLKPLKNDLGRGALNAVKAGLAAARDGAVVVVMADMSDDLRVLPEMHRMICAGYDLVAGSRYMPGGSQTGGGLLKSTLSRLAGRSLHTLTSMPTHDVTNAFRMYRTSFLRSVEIESTGGFELSLELTVKAWANGFRVGELPSHWLDREEGESKFQLRAWLPKYIHWYVAALKHHYLGQQVGSGLRK